MHSRRTKGPKASASPPSDESLRAEERARRADMLNARVTWRARKDLAKDILVKGLLVGLALTLAGWVLDSRNAERQEAQERERATQAEVLENTRAAQAEVLENTRFARQLATTPMAETMDKPLSHLNLKGARLALLQLNCMSIEPRVGCASFQEADLSDADLHYAGLYGADFYLADLSGANLFHAILNSALLVKADLTGANLIEADLAGANLSGADLRGADLTGAALTDVCFDDATRWGDTPAPSRPQC